jgi:CRP-like cAMP-binding protein
LVHWPALLPPSPSPGSGLISKLSIIPVRFPIRRFSVVSSSDFHLASGIPAANAAAASLMLRTYAKNSWSWKMTCLNQELNEVPEVKSKNMGRAKLLQGLEGIAHPIEREAGSILLCEGETGGIFLLCRGKARLTMYSRTGEKLAFRTVGPGYLLGLPASMRNQPYNYTVELLEDSQVAFIRKQDIPTVLRLRSDLCLRLVRTLCHELRRLQRATIPPAQRRSKPVLKPLPRSNGESGNGSTLVN